MPEIDRKILRQLSQATMLSDCPSIKVLGNLLDEKLNPDDKESVESHLRSCPACLNRLIELRDLAHSERARLTGFLAALLPHYSAETMEPPPRVVKAVISMVEPKAPPDRQQSISSAIFRLRSAVSSTWTASSRVYRPLAITGAAALATLLLVLVHSHQRRLVQNENGQPEQQAAESFSRGALSVQVAPAIATILAASNALNSRVLSALEKLPETMLPEETRNATDAAVYKKAAPATVLVVTNTGIGSGVVISSAGDILTNYHVIHGAKGVVIVFKPEGGVQAKKDRAYAASPIKEDEVANLALLRVAAPKGFLSPLAVAGVSNLQVGEHVHAIGNPEGEVWTYTTETVSQIRPKYEWKDEDGIHRATVVQTQTALNPGNSGGPLLDDAANVIGINSFRIEGEGLNYAIASDSVEKFLKRPTDRLTQQTVKQDVRFSRLQPFGDHIVGAYMKTRNPPPDVWLVFDKNGQPSYAVAGTSSKTRLNTVFKVTNKKKWVYYIDVNCGGVIDLIGYSSPGSGSIDRYQRPQDSIRLENLAPELADAFAKRLIPYRQVQFCSSKSTALQSDSGARSCNGRSNRTCS